MFKKIKENSAAISLLVTTLSIYGVCLGYTTAAAYRAGYLSYFGVSIDMVPFWPKISDFMIAPIVAIVYIIIATILALLAMVPGNHLGYWSIKLIEAIGKRKSQEALPRVFDTTTKYLTLIFFVSISFSLPYFTMQHFGENFARNTTHFTALTGRQTTTTLIYQHDGTGIVKEYNPDTKEFSRNYEVINLAGEKFEHIEIERPRQDR